MRKLEINKVVFDKGTGLVPAIIQDNASRLVLMQGYMNRDALEITLSSGKVTFYSRSKERLWTKGEESGNFLNLKSIYMDCDADSILIKVDPDGPTCHTGSTTCWEENQEDSDIDFLLKLEKIIKNRKENLDENSYTSSLFMLGINKMAQKVGEEAVEVVIESKDDNEDLFKGEVADLIFHLLVLLQAKQVTLSDVIKVLKERHKG